MQGGSVPTVRARTPLPPCSLSECHVAHVVSASTAHFDDQSCCQHTRPTSRSTYLPEEWGKTHLWYMQHGTSDHDAWHIRPWPELCLVKSSFQQCCELPGCGYVKGDTGKNSQVISSQGKMSYSWLSRTTSKIATLGCHPFLSLTTLHPTEASKSFWHYEYKGKATSSSAQWLLWPWWRNQNSFCLPKSCDLLPLLFSMRVWDLLVSISRSPQVPVSSWAFDTARQDRLCKVVTHIFNLVPLHCFSLPWQFLITCCVFLQ